MSSSTTCTQRTACYVHSISSKWVTSGGGGVVAAALDVSITVQRNWYNLPSNGEHFIKFVLKKVQQAQREVSAGKGGGATVPQAGRLKGPGIG
eukprot:1191211-Prorocentrum_minimum.AAC.2